MKLAAKAAGSFDYTVVIGLILLAVACVFVYRSFYSMRISSVSSTDKISNDSDNKKKGHSVKENDMILQNN
jgi:hypothetical protein